MDLERHIAERLAAANAAGAAICVGLSGGLDSIVLLDALARLVKMGSDYFFGERKSNLTPFSLSAVHVHHGLSPNADAWAVFCERECAKRGIACTVERVQVQGGAGLGLEAAARRARYAVYAARPERFVALAHHLDDQAETILLQLLRGTGMKGLAAMPAVRPLARNQKGDRIENEPDPISVVRPLLGVPREALRAYAVERQLAWIEDESNARLDADRNFLRHEIAPRLDGRFPGWRQAAARCAAHAGEAAALLHELGELDGAPKAAGAGLILDPALSAARRANALRAFLAAEGLAMPSEARLAEMARQLYEAKGDARVRIVHEEATLVRHRGVARIVQGAEAVPRASDWRIPWRGEARIELGPARGAVQFARVAGSGLRFEPGASVPWHFASRQGGERLRLARQGPSRTVKNLLREAGIPEWQRARLPLLFHGGSVAWVPGIGIAAELACAEGAVGLVPAWLPADDFPLSD